MNRPVGTQGETLRERVREIVYGPMWPEEDDLLDAVIAEIARAQRDADVAHVLACADRTERGNAARVEARACGHCLKHEPLVGAEASR